MKIEVVRFRRRSRAGFTFVEALVAMTVAGVIIAALIATSTLTLDQISRDIRQSAALTSYSSNPLVFSGGTTVSEVRSA